MKGLVVPTLGDPVVVEGPWDSPGVIAAVLGAQTFEVLNIPNTKDPLLSLYFDEEGKYRERDVNMVATKLMAGVLQRGDYIAGPALIAGVDLRTGSSAELDLLDLIKLGARLVRAERTELPRGPSWPPRSEPTKET